jgi:hypothetical protein
MKKLSAIILALSLVLTLAACGNGGGSSSGNDNNDRDNSEIENDNIPAIPDLPVIEENPVSDFEYKAIAGGIEITQYIGTSIRVRIPETIEGVPVISIGDLAFFKTGIMEVHVPSGVTNIGRSAFSGNEALTNITMADDTIKAGSLIHFGGVFWRVLEVHDNKALIISEDIIERRTYHTIREEITWEHSSMRQFLNDEFYNSFSSEEQERIVETKIINSDNSDFGTAGGNDTTDSIFLLSIDEAYTYFADNALRIALNANGETNWWWLRSPGDGSNLAAYIGFNGGIGYNDGVTDGNGVRPAMWIEL